LRALEAAQGFHIAHIHKRKISNKEVPEMLAYFARLIVFAVVTLTALPLSADWLCDFFNSVARDTKRRNCWPAPFVCPDRQAVRAPFAVMVNNGWRRQNMLGDSYFEPTTGQLTEAGKLKIRWIIFEAPEQHREIYVHIGQTNDETQARLATVTAQATSLAPQGEMPSITQTSISDESYPADRTNWIIDKYKTAKDLQPPYLQTSSGQSGGSSTGGQSGGSSTGGSSGQ
jgi:uncharacterized membrane protein YgcG